MTQLFSGFAEKFFYSDVWAIFIWDVLLYPRKFPARFARRAAASHGEEEEA